MVLNRRTFLVRCLVLVLFFFSFEWNGLSAKAQEDDNAAVVVLDDDASQLAASGWTVTRAWNGTYITDHAGTSPNPYGVAMKPVPEGQYLIYGDAIAAPSKRYTFMTKQVSIGSGLWILEFKARIEKSMRRRR